MNRSSGMVLCLIALFSVGAFAQNTVIYGDDNRHDLYEVTNSMFLSVADSTVALIKSDKISSSGSRSNIKSEIYGEYRNLCKDEKFYDQPTAARCSGFLVGPDLLLTAGHCVTTESDCKSQKFVFGFNVKKEGEYPKAVDSSEVYGCSKLIKRNQDSNGSDFALVRLDRKVTNHKPLELNTSGNIDVGTAITMIGHPVGIPTKIADGANVRDNSNPGFFVANTDSYGGNSGSVVFNNATGKVEGILVRGENDFVNDGDCTRSYVCANDGCRGEDVTKISAAAPAIAAALAESSR